MVITKVLPYPRREVERKNKVGEGRKLCIFFSHKFFWNFRFKELLDSFQIMKWDTAVQRNCSVLIMREVKFAFIEN